MAGGSGSEARSTGDQSVVFRVPQTAVDPQLVSLFALSSGPVKQNHPSAGRSSGTLATQTDLNHFRYESSSEEFEIIPKDPQKTNARRRNETFESDFKERNDRPRKRRRIAEADDLESRYLDKLAKEDALEEQRRQKGADKDGGDAEASSDEGRGSNVEDGEASERAIGQPMFEATPLHESLGVLSGDDGSKKNKRTVFLGNVSTSAIKSKSSKKILMKHLTKILDEIPDSQPPHKIESLRFRSTAFVSGAGPKKATFAKKELMDETTKSTHAYVVYSTAVAARKSAAQLNGTIVLDRHLRADLLAHPAQVDHKRCVFVGNLSFVDEETSDDVNDNDQEKPRRPKAKVPADAEEGLWRIFSKAGKVESVRVVRDKETRVGKGFAYVQFADINVVEAALLLNEKKFPPLLPRKLRVMRAKKTRQRSDDFRAATGRSGTEKRSGIDRTRQPDFQRRPGSKTRKPESFVFEGHRASSTSKGKDGKAKQKKRHAVKPTSRSSRRGATFKAAGGKSK